MWKNFLILLLGATAAVYAYRTFYVVPCAAPIVFHIGTLDPRFGVSKSEFLDDITKAGGIWDTAINKKLFVYDPSGSLTINLVYDTRQQTTQAANVLKTDINVTKQTASSAKQAYLSSQAKYQQTENAYKAEVADFTQAQTAYNAHVDYWNAKGGAPKDEYEKLTAEKAALALKQSSIEAKRQEVNQLADQTNALVAKYNTFVDNINEKVHMINSDGLAGTEFEEGVYFSDRDGRKIDIYQFDNQTAFVRVLAHELGHALGLAHNENPTSIMSPVNQSKSLVLSPQDLQELKTACRLQ